MEQTPRCENCRVGLVVEMMDGATRTVALFARRNAPIRVSKEANSLDDLLHVVTAADKFDNLRRAALVHASHICMQQRPHVLLHIVKG